MDQNMDHFEWLKEELTRQDGNVSCCFVNLITGERFSYRTDEVHPAASIIKLFLMAYVMQLIEEKKLEGSRMIPIPRDGLAPSAGILAYLQDVREMSVRDLMELMIIVSDNAATNILLDLVGMENVQTYIESQGFAATRFSRRMMDFEAARAGLENLTNTEEVTLLLERIYNGKLVSPGASQEMLRILKDQRFDELIPWHLSESLPEHTIAHKTGGLEHVVHDAAIIDAGKVPFILCFFGSRVDVPGYGRFMGDMALKIYNQIQLEAEEM